MELWERDIYLLDLKNEIDRYKIISFDIFDTILFRTCHNYEDVFRLTGEAMLTRDGNWGYSPDAYKNIRIQAECLAKAKKTGGADCTFEEIMDEMPFSVAQKKLLADLEIAYEKDSLYLNESIYSFLKTCHSMGKRIVLVSDMYHAKACILAFLEHAGFDVSLIDRCFVSSEQGAFKYTGQLFEKMKKAYPDVRAEEILHIGDNETPDVAGAGIAGIKARHYPVTNHKFADIFHYETDVYKARLGEIESLRRAVMSLGGAGKYSFMFSFGAGIIAPVYTMYAEWVVEHAREHGIKMILPFMREGTLLGKLIERVIEERELDMRCHPIYLSRRPVFRSSIFEENYDERISQELLRGSRRLKDVFDDFGIRCLEEFQPYLNQTVKEIRSLDGLKQIEEYLQRDDIRRQIISHSKRQRELLLEYLGPVLQGKGRLLTADIGTKGTTEKYFDDIMKYEGIPVEAYHALMIGDVANCTNHILNGMRLHAWLGIAGENDWLLERIKRQILVVEAFVNDTCGSTVGYRRDGKRIVPILEQEILGEDGQKRIEVCWDGIMAYQEQWIHLSEKKPWLGKKLLDKKEEFARIWLRFIEMPTQEEISHLSGFPYWDSYNQAEPTTLVGDECRIREAEDIKQSVSEGLAAGIYWPQAVYLKRHPEYPVSRLLDSTEDFSFIQIFERLQWLKRQGLVNGAVYCASELARKICLLAPAMGIHIQTVIDSDARLHGNHISEIPVASLAETPEDIGFIFIATYIYEEEIRIILDRFYRGKKYTPNIIGMGGDMK